MPLSRQGRPPLTEAPAERTWAKGPWPRPPACPRSENVPRGQCRCGLTRQLAWSLPWRAWGLRGCREAVGRGCATLSSGCTRTPPP